MNNWTNMTDDEKRTFEAKQLEIVKNALDRVHQEMKQTVYNIAVQMGEMEIVQLFNQQAFDMFTILISITRKKGVEKEYQFTGYKTLYDNAVKINNKMPLEKFTLIILEYAPEIYAEDENCFLNMAVPDTNVSFGNEFGVIRSEKFKELWKTITKKQRETLKSKIIPLTIYAHAYLYKSLLKHNTH